VLGEPEGEWLAGDLWRMTVFADPDEPAPLAAEEFAAIQARVGQAATGAWADPAHAKAGRLAGQLQEAEAALAAAKQAQADALKAARQAMADGADPLPDEAGYREAALEESVQANRVTTLAYLAEEARRAAARLVRQAVEQAMAAARQDLADRRRSLLHQAVAALRPFLPPIAALDRVEYQLFDFRSGGLPGWCAALLQPPAELLAGPS
jgi:hypothetical protein